MKLKDALSYMVLCNAKMIQKAKLQRKTKNYYPTSKNFPPLKRKIDTQLPSQVCKLSLVKGFG